jgi:hypothetical protein
MTPVRTNEQFIIANSQVSTVKTYHVVVKNSQGQVFDYICHRATNTWWRLKDDYNNVTTTINLGIEFVQLNSLEHLAVNLLIAENANIVGFVFKEGKKIS